MRRFASFLSALLAAGSLLAAFEHAVYDAVSLNGEWNGWGQDPAKRAFYKAFCDFNPLNDLGSG